MLTFEQFWTGLSSQEGGQQNAVLNICQSGSIDGVTTPEEWYTKFAKPTDRFAWRILRRGFDSMNPDSVTGDQEALMASWRNAFRSKGIDLDSVITDRDQFEAGDRPGMSRLLNKIAGFAAQKGVRLGDGQGGVANAVASGVPQPTDPALAAFGASAGPDYDSMDQGALVAECVKEGLAFADNGKVLGVRELRAKLHAKANNEPF